MAYVFFQEQKVCSKEKARQRMLLLSTLPRGNHPRGTSAELAGRAQKELQQEKHSWLSWDSDQSTKRKNLD